MNTRTDRHHSVNRWLSVRFNLLSSAVVGITAFVAVLSPGIDASMAGFALTFASSLLVDVSSIYDWRAVWTNSTACLASLAGTFLVCYAHGRPVTGCFSRSAASSVWNSPW